MRRDFCLLAIAMSLSGCMIPEPGTTDTAFDGAKAAMLRDMPKFDKAVHGDVRPVIVVEFSMSGDLSALAREHEYNLYSEASFCDRGAYDRAKEITSIGIYDAFGRVNAYRPPEFESMHSASGRHTYFIFLETLSKYATPFSLPPDFASNRQDVCFRVGGGNMLGTGFRSNTVIVPAAVLADAAKPESATARYKMLRPKAVVDAEHQFREMAREIQRRAVANIDFVAVPYSSIRVSKLGPGDFESPHLQAYRCHVSLGDRDAATLAKVMQDVTFAPQIQQGDLYWQVTISNADGKSWTFLMGRSSAFLDEVSVVIDHNGVDVSKALVAWFEQRIDYSRCTPSAAP